MNSDTTPPKAPAQRRWIMPLTLMVTLFVGFSDRMNITYALPKIVGEFGWNTAQTGAYGKWILVSFFVGYGLSGVLLSPLAEKIGPRRSIMLVIFGFSIFTSLGAPAAAFLPLFLATRVFLGFSEGVHFPMMAAVTKVWFPLHERSRATTTWMAGGLMATILTSLIVVPIIDHFGWRVMLVVCGAAGLLISIPMTYFFLFDTPRNAPYVSDEEAAYIESGLEQDEPIAVHWEFLKTPVFWLVVLCGVSNNFAHYGVLNWLPTYLVEAKGMVFEDLKYTSLFTYGLGGAGFLFAGWFGDKWNRRVLMSSIGFGACSIFLLLAVLAPGPYITMAFVGCATFCISMYISQEYTILQRILPASCIGRAAGIYNGHTVLLGSAPGIFIFGLIVEKTGSYNAGFATVIVAGAVATTALFILSRMVKY